MPIWSLTQERVEKLQRQKAAKQEEIDTLEKLSEKDLWCQDLDAFVAEWESQIKEDAEIEKDIRNSNRRRSRKIGAGGKAAGTGRGRPKKEDEDFTLGAKKTKPAAKPAKADPQKGVVKVENKPHQGFLDMFTAKPKAKPKNFDGADDSGMSDDDFAALADSKSSDQARAPSEQPAAGPSRGRRAAAAAPKNWVVDDDESESDDGKLLGDIGDMVKGIGGDKHDAATNGRLSLYAMSRSEDRPSSSAGLPKPKVKASKVVDLSDDDETNYEMLAKSSPYKAPATKDDVNSYLSSDEDVAPPTKRAPVQKAASKTLAKDAPKPKKIPVIKKSASAEEPKPASHSPAAKAYALKQNRLKEIAKTIQYSEDEDDDMDDISPALQKPIDKKQSKPAVRQESPSDDEDDFDMDNSPPRKAANGKRPGNQIAISDDDDLELEEDSPPPKPAAKNGKAKAVHKKKVIDDDEDDLEMENFPPPKPTAKSTKAKVIPKKKAVKDDEDDLEMEDDSPPKPAARSRGRPARAASVAKPKKPVYIDSEDDEDEMDVDDVDESAIVEEEESEEDFSD
jgi:DNA topoisomerase-2